MKARKVLSILIGGLLVIALLGFTGVQAKDKITIGVVVKTMGNPFFREIAYGAKEAGKLYDNVDVIIQATAKEGEIVEQINIIENLIERGVDGLVITPQNSKGIAPAIIEARRANVPCIVVDTEAQDVEVDSFVGMDNVEAGMVIAEMVCEKLGGKGNVAILEGMAGASSSILRSEGFRRGCAKFPGIKIVADQNADYRRDVGQRVMADILQAHHVDAVICCNDLMALGAIVSLEEAGYRIGKDVIIGSYDISDEILEEVKAGRVYVTGYHWGKLQGWWGLQFAVDMINGLPVPKRVVSPHSEITKEKVEPYLEFAKMLKKYKF